MNTTLLSQVDISSITNNNELEWNQDVWDSTVTYLTRTQEGRRILTALTAMAIHNSVTCK